MAEMGLSGVKLKDAPKDSSNTWVGVAVFDNGGGKVEQDITAFYNNDTNSIFYWFYDDMENMSEIPLSVSTEKIAETNPDVITTQPAQDTSQTQPVQNPSNTQSASNYIGKVEKRGTGYLVYNTSNSQTADIPAGNRQLGGWGKDFVVLYEKSSSTAGVTYTVYDIKGYKQTSFSVQNTECIGVGNDFIVLKSGTTFTTYTAKGIKIQSTTVSGATGGSVSGDTFTVVAGSVKKRFDKNCRQR